MWLNMNFDENQLIDWMHGVRTNPDMINAFWPSQIKSKLWVVDWLKHTTFPMENVIIFGSWYGVLADILKIEFPYLNITCNDIDEKAMEWCRGKHKIDIGDMCDYIYKDPVDIVINTSTEHMTQKKYDVWYDNIPKGAYYIIQGNNDSAEPDHIRSSENLDEFLKMNRVNNCLRKGELQYEGPWNEELNAPTYFDRYMAFGQK